MRKALYAKNQWSLHTCWGAFEGRPAGFDLPERFPLAVSALSQGLGGSRADLVTPIVGLFDPSTGLEALVWPIPPTKSLDPLLGLSENQTGANLPGIQDRTQRGEFMSRGPDLKPRAHRSRGRRLKTGSNPPAYDESRPLSPSSDTSPNEQHEQGVGLGSVAQRLPGSAPPASHEFPSHADSAAGKLETVLEAANIGTWEWNIQTGEVRWSRNMEQVHGQAPGSFGGTFEGFLQGVHHDDRTRVLRSTGRMTARAVPIAATAAHLTTAHRATPFVAGPRETLIQCRQKAQPRVHRGTQRTPS